MDIFQGRGQVRWRPAFRISIGRGMNSRIRNIIGLFYGIGFGIVNLQYMPWYGSFPQSMLVAFSITLLGAVWWRIRLKPRGRASFRYILVCNGALAWAAGCFFFLASLSLPIIAIYGWANLMRQLHWFFNLSLMWGFLYPITGLGLILEEDGRRRGLRLRGRAQRMALLADQARIVALRAQINPHFFFNALNTIAALIPTRPADAERAVELLADSLRPVLMREQPLLESVHSELQIARAYSEIELLRFGYRLSIEFIVEPEALPITMPSLCLQPLLENAIRHGAALIPESYRITIRIRYNSEGLRLQIDNHPRNIQTIPDIESMTPVKFTPGHALHNIVVRLKAIYGPNAKLEVRTAPGAVGCARLSIPVEGPDRMALDLDRNIRSRQSTSPSVGIEAKS